MTSGHDRTYDNSFPDVRDRFNQVPPRDPYNQYPNGDPYYNPNQFNQAPQYPGIPTYSTPQPLEKSYDHIGDFSPFYIAITICTIIAFALFILNIALGCCSRYSEYWNDRHTGNRWILSLWTATPHKQPPLDYGTELQEVSSQHQVVYHHPQEEHPLHTREEFLELRTKRESEI